MLSNPVRMMVLGFILVMSSWIVLFMIVLEMIPASFALNFLAYGASVSGLFLGILGAATYVKESRGPRKDE